MIRAFLRVIAGIIAGSLMREVNLAWAAPLADSSGRYALIAEDEGLPQSGQWRDQFDLADMNGDGLIDIVHGTPRGSRAPPSIHLGSRNGSWRQWKDIHFPPLKFDYGGIVAVDIDQDGQLDLALAQHLRGGLVLRSQTRGVFEDITPRELTLFSSRAAHAADLDGNGIPELYFLGEGPAPGGSTSTGVLRLSYGRESKAWQSTHLFMVEAYFGSRVISLDVGGTKLPDLVLGVSRPMRFLPVAISQGSALAPSSSPLHFPWDSFVFSLAASDLNKDGVPEILAGTTVRSSTRPETALLMLTQEPSPAPWKVTSLWTRKGATRISGVDSGDVSGDGLTDIVIGTSDGTLAILLGTSESRFSTLQFNNLGAHVEGCSIYHIRVHREEKSALSRIFLNLAGEEKGSRCSSKGALRVFRLMTSSRKSLDPTGTD